jgi:tRNA nucleotidyltransferase (CCA-adding enzyme)
MKDRLPPLQSLFSLEEQTQLYLVGGCVRDCLQGKTPNDLDLVTTLPEKELELAGFHRVQGKTTVPVWFRHQADVGSIEISLLEKGMSLADDLRRRDFTVNAIAMSLTGELIDPLNGQADLQCHLLRVCSNTSFQDDPLRLFRALRFESDGWSIDPATNALIRQQNWTAKLEPLPVERFSREMVRALSYKYPELFFQRMLEFEIGRHWLPELFQMPQVPAGSLQYHPEGDLFSHSIQVMQRLATLSDDPLVRFCGLFHDIGKLTTDPACYPRHHGHDQAGYAPSLQLCQRLKLPTVWAQALAWTARLHTKANNWDELRRSTRINLASQAIKAGIAQILPKVSAADKQGRGGMAGWDMVLQVCRMGSAELGIDQRQLEAIQPLKRGEFLLQKRVELLAADTVEV